MTTTTINNNLKSFNFSGIKMSEMNLKTYTIEYRYSGCQNWHSKEISAESISEAIFDAQSWIESENAAIGNRSKVGNYIDRAYVSEGWNTSRTALCF